MLWHGMFSIVTVLIQIDRLTVSCSWTKNANSTTITQFSHDTMNFVVAERKLVFRLCHGMHFLGFNKRLETILQKIMTNNLKMNINEFVELIVHFAARRKSPAICELDRWICWTLKRGWCYVLFVCSGVQLSRCDNLGSFHCWNCIFICLFKAAWGILERRHTGIYKQPTPNNCMRTFLWMEKSDSRNTRV